MAVGRAELNPGVKRFNRWQFVEAQNAWRELGVQQEGPPREFLLTLSNVAGGFAKIWHKGGEPHTMVSILNQAVTDLQKFAPRYLDLELESFIAGLTHCLSEAKRWRKGETEIFDRDLIPRVEFLPKARSTSG